MCTPYLQHTTPIGNCKHMKTKDFIFQPTASYLVVRTATGSSDSPAVHVFLLLGLPRHTPLGPSVPEELTQVFPVLVSPPLAELESSIENRKHSGVDIYTTGFSGQKESLQLFVWFVVFFFIFFSPSIFKQGKKMSFPF